MIIILRNEPELLYAQYNARCSRASPPTHAQRFLFLSEVGNVGHSVLCASAYQVCAGGSYWQNCIYIESIYLEKQYSIKERCNFHVLRYIASSTCFDILYFEYFWRVHTYFEVHERNLRQNSSRISCCIALYVPSCSNRMSSLPGKAIHCLEKHVFPSFTLSGMDSFSPLLS